MHSPNRSRPLAGAVLALASCLLIGGVAGCAGKPTSGAASPDASSTGRAAATTTVTGAAGPASTVPAGAWIDRAQLPLQSTLQWPDLAGIAKPLAEGMFRVEELCSVPPDKGSIGWDGADAARARVDGDGRGWALQQQIVHYPGDTWRMGQTAELLFTSLQRSVTDCAASAPGATVETTTPRSLCPDVEQGGCNALAAVVEVPSRQVRAHIYLAVVGSSVTELSVWSSGTPEVPWSAPSDREVFASMNPQLCRVWEC